MSIYASLEEQTIQRPKRKETKGQTMIYKIQNTTHKTKDLATRTQGVHSGAPEG